jgi:hypothetical protein
VVVTTTSATTYTDNALTLGGTYTYTVSAVDAVGNESATSTGAVVVYTIPLPSNILTVGPTGNYPTIAATVAGRRQPAFEHPRGDQGRVRRLRLRSRSTDRFSRPAPASLRRAGRRPSR